MTRVALAWSGGKDCAWALRFVSATFLITTYDEATGMVPHHNMPLQSILQQAEALRVPLLPVALPTACNNAVYIERFRAACQDFDTVVFGDLHLADIRDFRERSLSGIACQFPLWGRNTRELAREMIEGGLLATVTAAQDPALLGRSFDADFLNSLPAGTDPCGENGEFHTWVHPECLASFR